LDARELEVIEALLLEEFQQARRRARRRYLGLEPIPPVTPRVLARLRRARALEDARLAPGRVRQQP
jgi:hypothetical protein